MRVCDREVLVKFLSKKLEDDEQLDFLFHLDACPSCWEEVYNAEKETHPQYYKKTTKKSRAAAKELQFLERAGKSEDDVEEVA